MRNFKHIRIAHIEIHAKAGSEIDYCIQEAIEIAAKEWQNVILTHNERKYSVYVNDLMNVVLKAEESSRKLKENKA